MEFDIDGLPVLFPYPRIYPEQYAFMVDLKTTLDAGGKCILEMPSGTGKTIALLSLIVAYQQHYPSHRKLVYCSRTVSDVEKARIELKALVRFRAERLRHGEAFTGLCLMSQSNVALDSKGTVDNLGLAPYSPIPKGVWTLDDLLRHDENQHRKHTAFTFQRMLQDCNVIICSHRYLLDPKVAGCVSKDLSKDCIVVLDEAHNIDSVCIESLSTDITQDALLGATSAIQALESKIGEMRRSNQQKLQDEYDGLVKGVRGADGSFQEYFFVANPALPDDRIREPVPGNIRMAEHFAAFLRRFVEYLKARLAAKQVASEMPSAFLAHLKEHAFIEKKPLAFCAERLSSLARTLELANAEDYQPLQQVATFATLVATYDKGFLLILEPYESDTVLHFTCLDASIAVRPVFDRVDSVILTSGTMSPLEVYPKLLDFAPIMQKSYQAALARRSFLPMIVTRGSDQSAISTSLQVRNEPSVVRNYGGLLAEFAKATPDGIVVFFPSYFYMESIMSMWQGMGILDEVWQHKLILAETPDARETSLVLETYRTACCNGRGAVLLCVARGKLAEGIDFDHQYGRAILCMGVPFVNYTGSRIVKARLEFVRETCGIREGEFLSFDAMRQAASCLGSALRGKDDYALLVLADRRFQTKRAQLPPWIGQALLDTDANLSTDMAVGTARHFLKVMAQPFRDKDQAGISTWSLADLQRHQKKAVADNGADLMALDVDG